MFTGDFEKNAPKNDFGVANHVKRFMLSPLTMSAPYDRYIIAHVTGTSYLGKSGWTSKAFARRFDTYEAAEDFLIECGLDLEGANVEAV